MRRIGKKMEKRAWAFCMRFAQKRGQWYKQVTIFGAWKVGWPKWGDIKVNRFV